MANTISLDVMNRQHWERPGDGERLGCMNCLDRQLCGGIRPGVGVLSCRDYCCNTPNDCSRICPNKPAEFVFRQREVRGWEFDNVPRLAFNASPDVPGVIPELYHTSRRFETLRTKAVAVPLRAILNRSATTARFSTKSGVLADLRVSPRAAMVIDCIGRDRLIESFWAERHSSGLIDALVGLRPAWVIVPNYSVITNVPRWENFHAMKRIAIVWSEFMERGIPTVFTVNARTDRDWNRCSDFVLARPELQAIAIELGTGLRYADRLAAILPRVRALGLAADRRLRLFVRGGRASIDSLREAFQTVHLIDTNPFMKAVHRQRLISDSNGITSRRSFTLVGQPIEDLLQQNVQASQ